MKTNKILWLLLAGCLTLVACDDDKDDNSGSGTTPAGWTNDNANPQTRVEYGRLEMPRISNDDEHLVLIHKTADYKFDAYGVNYSVEWDCTKKAPRWIAYQMHKGYGGTAGRVSDIFLEDPDLPTSARFPDTNYQYSGSGFDRGHMCASADRQYSLTANLQTFYYTNAYPQYNNFNAGNNYTGEWVKMEEQLRTWTGNLAATDAIYVVKGGTIEEPNVMRYLKDGLIVPQYFFVALLKKTPKGYTPGLGLWFEHTNKILTSVNLAKNAISIRELESLTGIDFFCNLPDPVEEAVETMSLDHVMESWGLSLNNE